MEKIQFLIVAPRQKSGGSICLHYLCKLLKDKGYNAKVFIIDNRMCTKDSYKKNFWWNHIKYIIKFIIKKIYASLFVTKKNYNVKFDGTYYTPVNGVKLKYLPIFNKEKTIVLYPEIVYGNFLHAKYAVRWLLYYNRYKEDPDAFGKNDLFFAYREIFNDNKLNPLKRILTLSYFNLDLYKQTNFAERKGSCYVIRKGSYRNDLPKNFDGPIIDNYSEFEIVKTFNTYKYCILYDMQTAYASIAALCGCIPIQIPEPGKTRKDYCGAGEKRYGVAFDKSQKEIDWALNTRDYLIKSFKERQIADKEKIDNFINTCIEYFKLG